MKREQEIKTIIDEWNDKMFISKGYLIKLGHKTAWLEFCIKEKRVQQGLPYNESKINSIMNKLNNQSLRDFGLPMQETIVKPIMPPNNPVNSSVTQTPMLKPYNPNLFTIQNSQGNNNVQSFKHTAEQDKLIRK